jgi:hypothetical protein
LLTITCPKCGLSCRKHPSAVNRATRIGAPIYCGKVCSGLARQKGKSDAQRKEEKRLYDAKYREINKEILKKKKAEYFRATYDPEVAAEHRKRRMHLHVEYCRKPEYKAKKVAYDRQRRADEYGEFAETYLLLLDIDKEVNQRMSDYDVRIENQTINKRLKRKREHESTFGC